MEWRCEWCGKPHESNDPPCESCGHASFEKAVVKEVETVDTGPEIVWSCPNCERDHVKNSPPCSRCGNPTLEKRERTFEKLEEELAPDDWFSRAKPFIVVGIAILIGIALIVTGVIPVFDANNSSPTPPDAPGDSSTYANHDLEVVAESIHMALASEREATSYGTAVFDTALTEYATYINRNEVLIVYESEFHEEPGLSAFDPDCSAQSRLILHQFPDMKPGSYGDESTLAQSIVNDVLGNDRVRSTLIRQVDREGVDVHIGPDGMVFVAIITALC